MNRFLLALSVAGLLGMTGCAEDQRNTDEKLNRPALDFSSRHVMPCPDCGAIQRPYRITDLRSYYRCSGQPPKFKYHSEIQWTHAIDRAVEK